MILEERVVSRKTPLDGKLEVSHESAERIAALGTEFPLVSAGQHAAAQLSALECTCAKGAGARHTHHFIQSTVLQALAPGDVVRVEIDDDGGRVRIGRTDASS